MKGFFMGEEANKKKKYCLICHTFKPERCHHCQRCGRCVINMDHHCPWLENCIGYSNRKFFMLTVFYAVLCSFMAVAGLIRPALVHMG